MREREIERDRLREKSRKVKKEKERERDKEKERDREGVSNRERGWQLHQPLLSNVLQILTRCRNINQVKLTLEFNISTTHHTFKLESQQKIKPMFCKTLRLGQVLKIKFTLFVDFQM